MPQKQKKLMGLLNLVSEKGRRFLYGIFVRATEPKPIAEEHDNFLEITGQEPDPFDAIIFGADAIRKYEGSFSSHERHADQDGLTFALFLAKVGTADDFNAFYEKGGRFTDQCDAEGRTAGDILWERLNEARGHGLSIKNTDCIKKGVHTYHALVERQGGLIHIDEELPIRHDLKTDQHQSPKS